MAGVHTAWPPLSLEEAGRDGHPSTLQPPEPFRRHSYRRGAKLSGRTTFIINQRMTMSSPIYITETDARRLRPLVESAALQKGPDAANLRRLDAELKRAHIVSEDELPPDAITMNSTVELQDLEDGDRFTYTLVFPEGANVDQGRISILAPLGTAMLGYRVGDEFEWPVPAGTLRVRVLRLIGRCTPQATPSEVLIGAVPP